jgi:hypothetical protein
LEKVSVCRERTERVEAYLKSSEDKRRGAGVFNKSLRSEFFTILPEAAP